MKTSKTAKIHEYKQGRCECNSGRTWEIDLPSCISGKLFEKRVEPWWTLSIKVQTLDNAAAHNCFNVLSFKCFKFWLTLTLINFDGQCCCSQCCLYISIQVAEFGGTLGLFLGFSFMTLWDGLGNLSTALNMRENLGHFCNKVRNTK